ncbi:PKD domain-containing protein [Miltoncostaea marina]|uniref:PKD domain-containing protein n=1 Tax=Miltoncostaea marina TaxID=2843215 RepID=UPI001C3DF972|nr:PKD domain-containing protein [Miltoncostaea marina]
MTGRTERRRRTALAAAAASLAGLGWAAAAAEGTPGPPGAVIPSGYAALDPCGSPAPCAPTVTVGWDPASWSQGSLLHRRYVLEPLAGDAGLSGALETGGNLVTLQVPAPADGRLFRFKVFGRETKLSIPDLTLEIPRDVLVPDRIWALPDLRPVVPTIQPRIAMGLLRPRLPTPLEPLDPTLFRPPVLVPQQPIAPEIVQPFDPNRPDGPATGGEFRIDAAAPSLSVQQSATHVGAGEPVRFDAESVDPPSGPAPGSGVEAADHVWDFGDGTTATGRAVEHRYAAAGTFVGAVAVRDRVGNAVQRAFAVKVSPVRTDGVAAASTPKGRATTTRVGARARLRGAAALEALGVGMRPPVLRAAWRASRLQGSMTLRGAIAEGAGPQPRLRLRLRAAGLAPVDLGALPSGGGPFRRRIALPAGVLPGPLRVEMASGSRVVAELRVRVPAPAEGVARTAFVAGARRGAPLTRAPASTRVLFARFALASLPAPGRPLTVTWFQPNGDVAGHPVRKPRSRALTSFVSSGRALPPGRWRAVLTAGGVRVTQVVARVG